MRKTSTEGFFPTTDTIGSEPAQAGKKSFKYKMVSDLGREDTATAHSCGPKNNECRMKKSFKKEPWFPEILEYFRKEMRWWRRLETYLVLALFLTLVASLVALGVAALHHRFDLKLGLSFSALHLAAYRVIKLAHFNYLLACRVLIDLTRD